MANKTSPHILSTSANLLGFCLFVITTLHIANKTANSFVDEFATVIALFLTASSVFSFMSIKTKNLAKEEKLEDIADMLFIVSLFGILGVIFFILINYWQK